MRITPADSNPTLACVADESGESNLQCLEAKGVGGGGSVRVQDEGERKD